MAQETVVVFDLGNVLLPIDLDLTYAAFAHFSDCYNAEDIRQITQDEHLWIPYESGMEDDASFRSRIKNRLSLSCTDSEFDSAFNALLLEFSPSIVSFLSTVKNKFPIYLLSNTSAIHARVFMKRFDIFALFAGIHLSYEDQLVKPDQRIYRNVVEQNHLTKKNIIFFDDNAANIESAKAFGWDAVQINPSQSLDQIRTYLQNVC